MFFDRGSFWVLPLTYFYLPRKCQGVLFPQSIKIITFAAAPLVLSPFVRNQDARGRQGKQPGPGARRRASCPGFDAPSVAPDVLQSADLEGIVNLERAKGTPPKEWGS